MLRRRSAPAVRALWFIGACSACVVFLFAGTRLLYLAAQDGFLLVSTAAGVEETGTITAIDVPESRRRSRVVYQFVDANGVAHGGSSALPTAAADTLSLSEPLPVLYSPQSPSRSTAVPFRSFVLGNLLFELFFGVVALAVAVFFGIGMRALVRDRWQRYGFPGLVLRPKRGEA